MTRSGWPGVLVALGLLGCGGDRLAPAPPPSAAVTRAEALVDAPGPLGQTWPGLRPRDARALAARRAPAIPLPRGGNFDGIDWSGAAVPPTPTDVERTLRFNARCQWLRALTAGRQVAEARRVLRLAAGWRGVRGGPPAVLADCVASHAREVRRALTHGRRPSD